MRRWLTHWCLEFRLLTSLPCDNEPHDQRHRFFCLATKHDGSGSDAPKQLLTISRRPIRLALPKIRNTMTDSTYTLKVRKSIFCAGADLLPHMRQATPEETGSWRTTKVAVIADIGLEVYDYSVEKNVPGKANRIERLGRILTLGNGTSIVFGKDSFRRFEVRDAAGNVIDRASRCSTDKSARELVKSYLLEAYPLYEGFTAGLILYMLASPYRDIWMDFARVGKKRLKKFCGRDERPYLFWDLGSEVYMLKDEVEPYTAPESTLYWFTRRQYSFDPKRFQQEGHGELFRLHKHLKDGHFEAQQITEEDDELKAILEDCGAFEIVFKASRDFDVSLDDGADG